mmetsp:Transcript_118528/g.187689  ORF Transcript_118528/g.187689 Transcript_118528/m.187689 type:complete len:229 (-) Transcript_118528:1075-1761(-)
MIISPLRFRLRILSWLIMLKRASHCQFFLSAFWPNIHACPVGSSPDDNSLFLFAISLKNCSIKPWTPVCTLSRSPNTVRSFSLIFELYSFRSFKLASNASSITEPSPPVATALTSLSALDTSCKAFSEIVNTSWKPENLPAPANVSGKVAANSSRLLVAMRKPSSTVELTPFPTSRLCSILKSFACDSSLFLSCIFFDRSCCNLQLSCSSLSRCAKYSNLFLRLEDLN